MTPLPPAAPSLLAALARIIDRETARRITLPVGKLSEAAQ